MIEEFLSKSWDAYRRNFLQIIGGLLIIILVMFGIIIVSALPLVAKLIGYLSASSNVQSAMFQFLMDGGVRFSAALLVTGAIIALAISTLLEAGLVKMFADALKGKAEIGTMLSVARKKFWTILGANVFAGLIKLALLFDLVLMPLLIMMYESAYSASNTYYVPNIGITLWLYGGLITFLLLSLPFTLVNQFVVVGNLKAVEAVKKSFSVVRRNYLQFLSLIVVLSIISIAVSIIPIFGSLINFFAVVPVTGIAYTAFYLEKVKPAMKARRKLRKRLTESKSR